MKSLLAKNVLKRSFCMIAIFTAYQFMQMNTYSNENHSISLSKHEINNIPILIEAEKDILGSYVINPYYYKLALERKMLTPPEKIYSKGVMDELQLAYFLKNHNFKINHTNALEIALNYIVQCKIEGVNHDIAFAQMCLETGFLKFGGSVLPHQNNFCGLGAINTHSPGESFNSVEVGIIAHIQHLKAYACKDKLKSKLVDKRFKYVERGSAKTIHDLTGKWATDPNYGVKINKLLLRMYSI